jgi:hypothetical protein
MRDLTIRKSAKRDGSLYVSWVRWKIREFVVPTSVAHNLRYLFGIFLDIRLHDNWPRIGKISCNGHRRDGLNK